MQDFPIFPELLNKMSRPAGAGDASGKRRRGYHKVLLGKTEFIVDVRYVNLAPIGRGAYGLVASADDLVRACRVQENEKGCNISADKKMRVTAPLSGACRMATERKVRQCSASAARSGDALSNALLVRIFCCLSCGKVVVTLGATWERRAREGAGWVSFVSFTGAPPAPDTPSIRCKLPDIEI